MIKGSNKVLTWPNNAIKQQFIPPIGIRKVYYASDMINMFLFASLLYQLLLDLAAMSLQIINVLVDQFKDAY